MRNVVIAAVVLVAGVVGLFLPVSVFDGIDATVPCGSAVAPDHVAPLAPAVPSSPTIRQTIPHADLTAACETAISGRRHWAVPLVVVGVVGLILGVVVLTRRGATRRR
ncbi:aminopeptidase [Mycolicibacterium sp.]|uniref:aminopeptidase n=1 Tax=Mycolicibacterium sp. TaxID=2320850 RepID=UPI001A1A5F88|nr:aminopeptidase [Mycolicibacterium sp.]MBJ7340373.1 aminopeptidase [Mycolicibacterium sp.]